jgi:hypothetical protein
MLKRSIPVAIGASLLVMFSVVSQPLAPASTAQAGPMSTLSAPTPPDHCQFFGQTYMQVCGKFLDYWQAHGGLMQQGYPISSAFPEVSDIDGKTYTVQYFERAVFELHPENQPPYDVLLSAGRSAVQR